MDTLLLKSFLTLAKTKNFTKAANLLYRSQSAISLQIAKLEEITGKPLFTRDRRSVNLTVEGEQFLGYAHKILQIEEEMTSHFQKPSIKGEVTFGTPEDLATAYLPNILGNFVEAYPRILLNVHCEFTMDLLKGFESQWYDLILIKQDPQNPHPRSEEVWKEPLVWVANKEKFHFDWKQAPLPLVLGPSSCVYRKRAVDTLNKEGISWRVVYTSPSLTGTFAAVKAGLGISVLPLKMIPKELQMVRTLPPLKDAQIALLKQEYISEAGSALSAYVVDHIMSNITT